MLGKLTLFQASEEILNITSISTENTPDNQSYKRLDSSVHFYNLVLNEKNSVPAIHEYISINSNVRVHLSYQGLLVAFPEWFRYGHNCTLTTDTMLQNFASNTKNKGEDNNKILKELDEIQHYKHKVVQNTTA